MALTDKEKATQITAIEFAKKHKKSIAKRITDTEIYISEADPVSVFMAGSPGAGKTESSIELIKTFEKNGAKILRVDPDILRDEFSDYTGDNSYLFQSVIPPIIIGVKTGIDYAA